VNVGTPVLPHHPVNAALHPEQWTAASLQQYSVAGGDCRPPLQGRMHYGTHAMHRY
jgi:hypothetical protein